MHIYCEDTYTKCNTEYLLSKDDPYIFFVIIVPFVTSYISIEYNIIKTLLLVTFCSRMTISFISWQFRSILFHFSVFRKILKSFVYRH